MRACARRVRARVRGVCVRTVDHQLEALEIARSLLDDGSAEHGHLVVHVEQVGEEEQEVEVGDGA